MPKFLAGCHYNEEKISRHLKKIIGYWAVQMNGNKFATSKILGKPVEVVKGWILAGWAHKSPEPKAWHKFQQTMLESRTLDSCTTFGWLTTSLARCPLSSC